MTLQAFKAWFSRPSLSEVLNKTKKVKIEGFIFEIKKLDPLDYLDGSQSLTQIYQTYEQKRSISEKNTDKIRAHYRDVLMSGVVSPTLVRSEKDLSGGLDEMLVDKLLAHWEITNRLYLEIMAFTYGKKNFRSILYQSERSPS